MKLEHAYPPMCSRQVNIAFETRVWYSCFEIISRFLSQNTELYKNFPNKMETPRSQCFIWAHNMNAVQNFAFITLIYFRITWTMKRKIFLLKIFSFLYTFISNSLKIITFRFGIYDIHENFWYTREQNYYSILRLWKDIYNS